jgi:CRISPR system Cascade subunit CasE
VYLTRIEPNLMHPLARGDVADPYQMHSTLARMMSASDDVPPANFLWRAESLGVQGWQILLQSEVLPTQARLTGQRSGWASDVQTKQFSIEAFLGQSQTFRFRLRANPSVFREGKRHGLFREADQVAWLFRQGEQHGFTVESSSVSQAGRMVGHRRKGAQAIVVFSALFDGVLRVTDTGLLQQALERGVGRAKHMGLGLLSLAPANL